MFSLKQVFALVLVVFILISGATGESEGFNSVFDFVDGALRAAPELIPVGALGLLVGAAVDVLKAAKLKIKGKELKIAFGPGMASLLALAVNFVAYQVLTYFGLSELPDGVADLIANLGLFAPLIVSVLSMQIGSHIGHAVLKAAVPVPAFSTTP